MDRFLGKFSLPRLNQEEIEIMNNPVTSTEIEAVIKKKKISPKSKAQDQMLSQENSIRILEKSWRAVIHGIAKSQTQLSD